MTYADHLRALVRALLAASPGLSAFALSRRAGVGNNWVANFLTTGQARFDRADRVVAAIRDLCPQGPQGDEVRRLLALLDAARDEAGCPAEDAA